MMRLDKYLAHAKLGTRKEVKKIIRSGDISVNGEVCRNDDLKIDEDKDVVCYGEEEINYKEFYYILLNKPKDYISSTLDEHYPSVLNLIAEDYAFDLFPVGRLDVDTEGLLLLTNDGKLSHALLSPSKHVEKQYYAELIQPLNSEAVIQLEQGIELDDGLCKPCKIDVLSDNTIYITITEGRFHQVKRMMHAVNNDVTYLKRVRMGDLVLNDELELGHYYELSNEELELIKGGK